MCALHPAYALCRPALWRSDAAAWHLSHARCFRLMFQSQIDDSEVRITIPDLDGVGGGDVSRMVKSWPLESLREAMDIVGWDTGACMCCRGWRGR